MDYLGNRLFCRQFVGCRCGYGHLEFLSSLVNQFNSHGREFRRHGTVLERLLTRCIAVNGPFQHALKYGCKPEETEYQIKIPVGDSIQTSPFTVSCHKCLFAGDAEGNAVHITQARKNRIMIQS